MINLDKILESLRSTKYVESVDINSSDLLNDLKDKNLLGGPTCRETSEYVASQVDGAKAVPVRVVMKAGDLVSIDGHYAVLLGDKIYDFTAGQYSNYPGPSIPSDRCIVLVKSGKFDKSELVMYSNDEYDYKLFI